MKILRLHALVDIARYQSNFSEYEGKSPKKEWKYVSEAKWKIWRFWHIWTQKSKNDDFNAIFH